MRQSISGNSQIGLLEVGGGIKRDHIYTFSSHPAINTVAANPFSLFQICCASLVRSSSVIAGPPDSIISFCAAEFAIRLPSCGFQYHHAIAKNMVHMVLSR